MGLLAKQERIRVRNAAVPGDLLAAIAAKDPVSGYTHNFYRYPARFSPLFVREVIRHYSEPGEVVLDPFMGGGTAIVEAIALGRKAIGVDLNSLAHFVASVKTTPLSNNDVDLLQAWLAEVQAARRRGAGEIAEPVRNLPRHLQRVWADLMAQAAWLPLERQRHFVRCALLKTGQWAIDCKDSIPSSSETAKQFAESLLEMLEGAREFVESCRMEGVRKSNIRKNRLLLCRSAAGLETESQLRNMPKPKLVVTSPPYPAVHILYHRWQVQGRRETPAPYWLAVLKDGHAASHYTFGSRSPLGLENYFRNVEECFRSVRQVVARNAIVVQLVAFSDSESQLPRYLAAMELAGFAECDALALSRDSRVWRRVPNRKWYCHNGKEQDSAKEVVLFHCPV
jgi:DNA modification methylase